MRPFAFLAALVFALSFNTVMPAQADDRMVVVLPDPVRAEFLEEMRHHMATLDLVVTALASRDFRGAADMTDLRMGFGHRMIQMLEDQGVDVEQQKAIKQAMKAQGKMQGAGRGGHKGKGPGAYMPDSFRAMGQAFHSAAEDFAVVAKAVPENATAKDYMKVLEALSDVTAQCAACHATFKVKQ